MLTKTHTHPLSPQKTGSYALLLASLGNPTRPLLTTRHSAGHILLSFLATSLTCPPFTRSKPHAGGQITRYHSHPHLRTNTLNRSNHPLPPPGGSLTLWKSPTAMNLSGPAVLAAWRTFVAEHQQQQHHHQQQQQQQRGRERGDVDVDADTNPDPTTLGLLILHDDLETSPGSIRVRRGLEGSVKGHNGLKSVVASFRGAGLGSGRGGTAVGADFLVRVGVGIGRPPMGGRGRVEVSDFVLGRCSEVEMRGIEGLVGRLVSVCEEEGRRLVVESPRV
jgi:peptidyl-tRNA hydrolase, PTH1 family